MCSSLETLTPGVNRRSKNVEIASKFQASGQWQNKFHTDPYNHEAPRYKI